MDFERNGCHGTQAAIFIETFSKRLQGSFKHLQKLNDRRIPNRQTGKTTVQQTVTYLLLTYLLTYLLVIVAQKLHAAAACCSSISMVIMSHQATSHNTLF